LNVTSLKLIQNTLADNIYTKNIIVGSVYRPPGTNISEFIDCLNPILDQISKQEKVAFIMGDFYINLLNNGKHKPTAEFIEHMFAHSYIPLITKPTRITDQSATLIDNIFTNNTYSTHQRHVGIMYTDISDHFPIYCFDTKLSIKKKDFLVKKRDINSLTIQNFKHILNSFDWTFLTEYTNRQVAYSAFHNTFLPIYDNCFP
jgi:hypothetical protein